MAWTNLSYSYGSVLTSAKMTQLYDNLAALAAGSAGAPVIQGFLEDDVGVEGVGSIAICILVSGTLASGGTTAASGIKHVGGSALTSGTWRNISNATCTAAVPGLPFQRIS